MSAAEGTTAPCARCGAPLRLSVGGRARCVFCLHTQTLPKKVARTLEEDAALARDLGELEAAVLRTAKGRFAGLLIVGVSLPLLGMVVAGLVKSVQSAAGDPLALAMFGTIGFLGVLPMVLVPIGWMVVQEGARDRQLAALPTATPVLDAGSLRSACPRCGAPHTVPTGDALTVTCGSCQTEALLPLPLVDAKLARRHRAIVDVKARGEAEIDARKAAVAQWQRLVKPGLLIFGSVFFVLMLVFIAAAEMRTP